MKIKKKLHMIVDITNKSDEEVIEILRNIVNTYKRKGPLNIIQARGNESLVRFVYEHTKFLDKEEYSFVNFQTRLYMLIHGMGEEDFPRCQLEGCGVLIRFNVISVHRGFRYFHCCSSHSSLDKQVQKKRQITCTKLYNDQNFNNREQAKTTNAKKPKEVIEAEKKLRRENLERKLEENPNYWADIQQKTKTTKLQRHGNPNYNNPEKRAETREKMVEEDPDYWKKISEKRKDTNEKVHGDRNFGCFGSQSFYIANAKKNGSPTYNNREKAKKTCNERYGVDNYSKTEEFTQRMKQTCIEKYQTDSFSKTQQFKDQMISISQAKYDSDWYFNSEMKRLNWSLRINTEYYNRIMSEKNRAKPLFTFEDYIMKTPATVFSWICKDCGCDFQSHVNFEFARKTGSFARCPICYPNTGGSLSQTMLLDYAREAQLDTKFFYNDRTLIKPLELDLVLANKKIAIEFDGLYWHSLYSGGNKEDHSYKTMLCNKIGYQLIHVFEDEWEHKQKQCQNKLKEISTDQLHEISQSFEVKRINDRISKKFIDDNSQLLFNNKHEDSYGLYIRDELMSVACIRRCPGGIRVTNVQNKLGFFNMQGILEIAKVIKNKRQGKISIDMDNRWPFPRRLLEHLQILREFRPHPWLMHIFGGREEQDPFEFVKTLEKIEGLSQTQLLHENNYTIVYDAGKTTYKICI